MAVSVRFLQAVRHPPKLGIDLKADEIEEAILEIVSEGNALLVHAHAQQEKVWESKYFGYSFVL